MRHSQQVTSSPYIKHLKLKRMRKASSWKWYVWFILISHWPSWDSNPSQVPGRRGGEGHQHRWGWLEWLGWLGPMTTWNAKMDSGDEKEAWLLVLRLTSHKSTRASRNMQLMWQTSTSMNSLVFAQQAPSKKAGELERSFRQPFQGNQLAKSANSDHICTMMYTCSGGPWEEWRAGFSAATTSTEVEAPEKKWNSTFHLWDHSWSAIIHFDDQCDQWKKRSAPKLVSWVCWSPLGFSSKYQSYPRVSHFLVGFEQLAVCKLRSAKDDAKAPKHS